jgi:hypothetical protein
VQLQHLQPGQMFELGNGEIVQVVNVSYTDGGLLTLQLSKPGTRTSWLTAPMQPSAVLAGGLVE